MKARYLLALGALIALIGAFYHIAFSQSVPQLVNYQGRIMNKATGQPLDGVTVDLTFTFYPTASGDTALITVLQEDVLVSKGIYNVLVGSGAVTPGLETKLAEVFHQHFEVWMGVKVDSGSEMTPRTRVASAPYSLRTSTADPVSIGDFVGKPDYDGDGFLKAPPGGNTVDCNDGDASVYPGAEEQ